MNARHRLPADKSSGNSRDRTRKWLLPVMILVLIKIFYLSSFSAGRDKASIYEMFDSDVSAKEKSGAETAGILFAADNGTEKPDAEFDWNYELIAALKKREAVIFSREDALEKEEERLKEIKKEIQNNVDELLQIEERITKLIESKKAVEDEKLLKLAKVFEATPPEQAGPLLSKLDTDISAQLILKMSSRKAGKIWGYVEPGKAVKISKELARLKPDFNISKISGQ